jgi:hypothetical protein
LSRSRTRLALASLVFAVGILASGPSSAGTFAQSWSVSAWSFASEIGNADSDIQPELLFLHKVDGHYAIFDELGGTMEKDFPGFSQSNSSFGAGDVDGDGRTDLVFQSYEDVVPPFFKVYRWNGTDYALFLSHADSVFAYGLQPFRTAGHPEIYEISKEPLSPGCDLRLRDLSGNVLFRASTNLPGWSGSYRQSVWLDRDGDGISELLIEDQNRICMFNDYNGSFTVAWALPGWQSAAPLGNVDGDPQSELLVVNNSDAHYGIVDALTGALEQEFPAFTFPATSVSSEDVDSDGRGELIARKSVSGQPLAFSIHRWNGSTLAPFAAVTATHEFSNMGLLALRNASQLEILELAPTDFLVRDLTGALLFRASTSIPGWSVAPFSFSYATSDPDLNGIPDVILHDPSHVWDVHYGGTFAVSWTATGWRYFQDLGNVDADASPELMLTNAADDRFALFDALTGTNQQEFPAFTSTTSLYYNLDVTGDGQPELLFGRQQGQTPLFTAYQWNGATFVPTSSHANPMGQWNPVQLRSDTQFELLEIDDTDIRVRDLAGTVLFRASTDLPGWPGLPSSGASPAVNFPDLFGPRALFVFDAQQTRFVLSHATAAASAPGASALRVFPSAPNPFRTTTAFRLSNPRAGEVGIRIFDAVGRLVRRLDRALPEGESVIQWDGRDDGGRSVPSGVLFYEVTIDGARQTRKLVRT